MPNRFLRRRQNFFYMFGSPSVNVYAVNTVTYATVSALIAGLTFIARASVINEHHAKINNRNSWGISQTAIASIFYEVPSH